MLPKSKRRGRTKSTDGLDGMNGEAAGEPWEDVRARVVQRLTMTRTFRPEPEASAQLEDTALSYESERPGFALEFVKAVDLALEQITGWPQIGRRVTGLPDDLPVRRVLVCASPTMSCTCRGKMRVEFWSAYNSRELGFPHANSLFVSPTDCG